MKIHEYQAKALLRESGVAVPPGDVTDAPAGARAIAERLGGRTVVKAQVHAGGRGKGGGIKLADDPAGAEAAAKQILGMRLKTPQTPPEGILVRKVMVEEASAIERELYLSITLARARATHVVMASPAGGISLRSAFREASTSRGAPVAPPRRDTWQGSWNVTDPVMGLSFRRRSRTASARNSEMCSTRNGSGLPYRLAACQRIAP